MWENSYTQTTSDHETEVSGFDFVLNEFLWYQKNFVKAYENWGMSFLDVMDQQGKINSRNLTPECVYNVTNWQIKLTEENSITFKYNNYNMS